MNTSLVLGLLWLVVAFPLAILIGRALRSAGPRDDRRPHDSWAGQRRSRQSDRPVEADGDLPVHVDPDTETWWYRVGDRATGPDRQRDDD